MLESAYTSGGISTMVDTFAGQLDNLSYETLRYPGDIGEPGHWETMRMYRDNGWFEDRHSKFTVDDKVMLPRHVLESYLAQTLPREQPDYLALMVALEDARGERCRITVLDKMDQKTGLSAMQRTTGYSAAICAHMLASGEAQDYGVLKHEVHIPAESFVRRWREVGINVMATVTPAKTAA